MQPATLRKLHSFTGLFPLGAYLLFHAYEHAAVREGRDAAVRRLAGTSHALLEVLLVLLPLLLHAALGVRLARRQPNPNVYASPAFARLQLWTGVCAALFLLLHVSTVWGARVLQQRPAAAYGAMQEQVGTLPAAVLYLIGVSAVCLHFGQGLSSSLLRHGVGLSPCVARALGALIGLGLWLTFVDELSAYVTGSALL
jgi:succinate dehydrogenase / fumarate reductase cytochrome b subunit